MMIRAVTWFVLQKRKSKWEGKKVREGRRKGGGGNERGKRESSERFWNIRRFGFLIQGEAIKMTEPLLAQADLYLVHLYTYIYISIIST